MIIIDVVLIIAGIVILVIFPVHEESEYDEIPSVSPKSKYEYQNTIALETIIAYI